MITLALLATGICQASALAGEDSLREEIAELQRRAEALEAQRQLLFEKEIDSYLARTEAARTLQGGDDLERVSLTARLTAVALATVGADPSNTTAVHGDVELDFDFTVTDNLDLFVYLTANTNPGAFPAQFGPIAGSAGATLSGLHDGIGVDGTVSTAPGSIRVREAGFIWAAPVGDHTLHVMVGKLDPRDHYAQNAFAQDAQTQFLNNLFDDPPALNWPTNASGTNIYGVNFWLSFGSRDQYRVDFGWFNVPGQWFNQGLLLLQFTWSAELLERAMNLRLYGHVDTITTAETGAFGLSWDWYATDKIGVFLRATVKDNQSPNAGETNQVESDWQGGVVFFGLIPSRPDDDLGVAAGYIKGPIRAMIPGGAPENHELVIEVYYRFMHEGGKLQITPVVQFIIDPGGGTFADPDRLVLLGIRIFVPF
ncbi:MAG: carbohydrate porin [Planctomycetota bacterium]